MAVHFPTKVRAKYMVQEKEHLPRQEKDRRLDRLPMPLPLDLGVPRLRHQGSNLQVALAPTSRQYQHLELVLREQT